MPSPISLNGSSLTFTVDTEWFVQMVMGVGVVILVCTLFWFIYSRLRHMVCRFFWSRKSVLTREGVERRWEAIQTMFLRSNKDSQHLALIEADKLLGEILVSMSMPGSTFAERLRFAQNKYHRLKEVWWAHKLRNQLVHDLHASLSSSQIRVALKVYELALKEIGSL